MKAAGGESDGPRNKNGREHLRAMESGESGRPRSEADNRTTQLVQAFRARIVSELESARERLEARCSPSLPLIVPVDDPNEDFLSQPLDLEKLLRGRPYKLARGRWPASWPEPLTLGGAFDHLLAQQESLTEALARQLLASIEVFVGKKYRIAVCSRISQDTMWPLPESSEVDPRDTWHLLHWLSGSLRAWPGRAAPLTVATWAKEGLNEVSPGLDRDVIAAAKQGLMPGISVSWKTEEDNLIVLPAAGLGVLYIAEQDVVSDLNRDFVAVDASRSHHDLLSSWRSLPKNSKHDFETIQGSSQYTVKLLIPNEAQQLLLSFSDVHETLLQRLRDWRGFQGIRHWTAFLCQLSTHGGRTGWVRWTMEQHLNMLGYGERRRRDIELLESVAGVVELMTEMELVIYDKSGVVRERKPLILVGNRYERLLNSQWRLDGMELQINPLLYQGVRNQQTNELGSNWFPAPINLARVNHTRNPHTMMLGLILPIRWRWAWAGGKDHISLQGIKLLELAGIPYQRRRAAEAWRKLERDLRELKRIDGIGRWEWEGEPDAKTLCKLYPAEWMLDRTIRGLRPLEGGGRPADLVTGKELRVWRKGQKLSAQELADRLGVGVATVWRAEARKDKKLGRAIKKALESFGERG